MILAKSLISPLILPPAPLTNPFQDIYSSIPDKILELASIEDGKTKSQLVTGDSQISNWIDLSGNGNDVPQAISANQPIYAQNILNGRPALSFDGVDDFMRTGATFGLTQPNTIFLVWEIASLPTVDSPIVYGTTVEQARNAVEINGTGGEFQMDSGVNLTDDVSLATNTPYITSSLFNMANSEGYINGTLAMSGDVGINAIIGITIGSNRALSVFTEIKIGQIIYYDRLLTNLERQVVEGFLSQKFGIAVAVS